MALPPVVATLLRLVALGWLLAVGPLDLATTISRWLPRLLDAPPGGLVVLTLARAATAALGIAVGLSMLRRAPGAAGLATVWACLEVVTLMAVWVRGGIPSNRPPGLLLPTALVYLALAAIVRVSAGQVSQALLSPAQTPR